MKLITGNQLKEDGEVDQAGAEEEEEAQTMKKMKMMRKMHEERQRGRRPWREKGKSENARRKSAKNTLTEHRDLELRELRKRSSFLSDLSLSLSSKTPMFTLTVILYTHMTVVISTTSTL